MSQGNENNGYDSRSGSVRTTTCPRCGAPLIIRAGQGCCEYCDYLVAETGSADTADQNRITNADSGNYNRTINTDAGSYSRTTSTDAGDSSRRQNTNTWNHDQAESDRNAIFGNDKYAYTDSTRSAGGDKYAYTDSAESASRPYIDPAVKYAYDSRPQPAVTYPGDLSSPKSRTVALALCLFLGVFGVHRFYAGRIITGILYLLTFGVFGFGVLVDLILIILGNFKDRHGRKLLNW